MKSKYVSEEYGWYPLFNVKCHSVRQGFGLCGVWGRKLWADLWASWGPPGFVLWGPCRLQGDSGLLPNSRKHFLPVRPPGRGLQPTFTASRQTRGNSDRHQSSAGIGWEPVRTFCLLPSLCSHRHCLWRNAGISLHSLFSLWDNDICWAKEQICRTLTAPLISSVLGYILGETPGRSGAGVFGPVVREMLGRMLGFTL